MNCNIVEINGVSKKFGNKQVLKNINLTIPNNKIIGLVGKNGSGKTTLLKMLAGLLTVDEGEIKINGNNVGVLTKKDVCYLPDAVFLDDADKVVDSVIYFSTFFDDFNKQKALDLIKEFDIDVNQKVSRLSKGMKEKVCLSLAISRGAKVFLLDEPLGGVDPASRDYILDTILKNLTKDACVIISTHLISDIEKILDDVIFLDDGKIDLFDDVNKLREKENASIDEIFRRMFYVR